jgi:hypothetical protein
MSLEFSIFYIFVFRIVFGRTCYGTTVVGLTQNRKTMALLTLTKVDSFYYITCEDPRGDHWAKIVEQRAIKNKVQYIHCR